MQACNTVSILAKPGSGPCVFPEKVIQGGTMTIETKQTGKRDSDWLEEDFWADPEYANAALEGIAALERGAQTVSLEHLRAERVSRSMTTKATVAKPPEIR